MCWVPGFQFNTGRTDELWTPSGSEIEESQAPPPGNTPENMVTLLLDFSVPQFTNCSQRGIMCVIFQSVCPGIIYMNCKWFIQVESSSKGGSETSKRGIGGLERWPRG